VIAIVTLVIGLAFFGSLVLAGAVYYLRRKHDKEKDAKDEKRKQFDDRIKARKLSSKDTSFVPLIYDIDGGSGGTEYNLEESEDDMRTAMDKGEKQVAEAQEALAKHISHMQEKLQEARDTRCGKSGTAAREEFIAQCQREIGKGSGSAAVYQAVFQTIEGPESEGMAKYQVAAKALQNQLRQAAPGCEQTSAGLDDLYKQALSVEDRALEAMNGLRTPSESSKDSAGGWRLEKPALKKLRCAIHTHPKPLLMPPLHLSTSPHDCSLCAVAAVHAKRLCWSLGSNQCQQSVEARMATFPDIRHRLRRVGGCRLVGGCRRIPKTGFHRGHRKVILVVSVSVILCA